MKSIILIMTLMIVTSPVFSQSILDSSQDEKHVSKALDAFHQAAAEANFDTYFGSLTDDAIFLGTDASERWTKKTFAEFVKPYFSNGQGWLYSPTERNVSFINGGTMVFFDELLESKSYGTCRGTGVLVKTQNGWKISQYSLSIPIPNAIAKDVVKLINLMPAQ